MYGNDARRIVVRHNWTHFGRPLSLLHSHIHTYTGISKLVATIFILQFSLKIPVWLGVYEKVPLCGLKKMIKVYCCNHKKETTADQEENDSLKMLSLAEIRFNVMWNLWREVTECGVYLIPFILGSSSKAIPLSAMAGVAIAVVLVSIIYMAINQRMKNKHWVAFFMAGLMLMLSVGLLVGAVSEFQSLAAAKGSSSAQGETVEDAGNGPFVYTVQRHFFADDRFPFVLLKPFGYSDKRTLVQILCFWLFLAFGLCCHYVMYYRSKQVRALRQEEASKDSNDTDEEAQEEISDEEAGANTNHRGT